MPPGPVVTVKYVALAVDIGLEQPDDGFCRVMYVDKTVNAFSIPGEFVVDAAKDRAAGIIPVSISQDGAGIGDDGGQALSYSSPDFHLAVKLADGIVGVVPAVLPALFFRYLVAS